jgi:hypothetical protein
MMRVVWSILFGLVLCFSLGCGGGDEQPEGDTPAPAETTQETAPPLEAPPP